MIKLEIFENWDIAKGRKFYKLNSLILVLRTRLGEVLINPANHERRLNEGPLMRPQKTEACLLYTSPSPRDLSTSRMPSSA